MIIGGVDKTGSHLNSIHPHGSIDNLPFLTMGSGSLAAMAVFEANYKADMTVRILKILQITWRRYNFLYEQMFLFRKRKRKNS